MSQKSLLFKILSQSEFVDGEKYEIIYCHNQEGNWLICSNRGGRLATVTIRRLTNLWAKIPADGG